MINDGVLIDSAIVVRTVCSKAERPKPFAGIGQPVECHSLYDGLQG